jgi:hypothetical protein
MYFAAACEQKPENFSNLLGSYVGAFSKEGAEPFFSKNTNTGHIFRSIQQINIEITSA